MKIASFIQRYPPAIGGSETWCYEVSRFLSKIGHRVKVFTLAIHKEAEYVREPLDSEALVAMGKLMLDEGVLIRRYRRSVPIHSVYHLVYRFILDKLLGIYFFGPHSAEMYSKIWREIRNADVVFLNTAPYPHNLVVLMLAKLFGKKTVFVPHFHPAHPHYERKSIYWLLKRCDAVITVSEYERSYLEKKGVKPERLFVTGNAIHPEEYIPEDLPAFSKRMKRDYGLCEEDKVVLFLGRKTPEKGVAHLIEAV
jgi:glycosyltransferase involved in cell wall biosynthesis